MKEVWKKVPDFESSHEVSNFGSIRTVDRKVYRSVKDKSKGFYNRIGKIICQPTNNCGYLKVTISANGKNKTMFVHRVVAISFLEKSENKPCVNHIDLNKKNNRVENLEWCTYQENMDHYKKEQLK